jgi:hypothetical protein
MTLEIERLRTHCHRLRLYQLPVLRYFSAPVSDEVVHVFPLVAKIQSLVSREAKEEKKGLLGLAITLVSFETALLP